MSLRRRSAFAVLAVVAITAVVVAVAAAQPRVKATKCTVFPSDNPWNQPVDQLPVASDSAALVRSIGIDASAHADFGSGNYDGGPIGVPYKVVSGRQKKVAVKFDYSDESDHGRYPIPKNVPIEGGRKSDGDRHVIVIDKAKCRLYELYDAHPKSGGRSWTAGSGAIWSLKSDKLRPAGWTSADAAGLPIFPGLARFNEVAAGAIDHALRFTAPRTRKAYVYPARHQAGSSDDASLPPMGARLRLKASVDISGYPRQARIVLTALKKYGMILADNGSPWYISGAPDSHWNNDDLHSLGNLSGSDFEVVDTSSLPTPGA